MSLSTHVLDTSAGRPAAGIAVSLARRDGSVWTPLSHMKTDQDGRVRHLLPEGQTLALGIFRIRFETAAYFAAGTVKGLYPWIDIVFEVDAAGLNMGQHFHIPVLLTPNSYTTYRGS